MNISTVNISGLNNYSFPSPMLPDIPLHQEISESVVFGELIFTFGILGTLLVITIGYGICKEIICAYNE